MNRFTQRWLLGCLLMLLMVGRMSVGEDKPKADQLHPHPPAKVAFLGVAVEPLHPAFWAHLKDLAQSRYGVIVEEVGPGSPAEKAGIQPHDILMMFGDQKVYNPHQLHSLVHASKPGEHVKLQILRGGIPQEVMATLGEHTPIPRRNARVAPKTAAKSPGWEMLDSMSIKKLPDGKFQVEITYESKNNTVEHRTFEGTRDEIFRDIQSRKDLPDSERADLLRALDLSTGDAPASPDLYITPDGKLIFDLNGFNAF